MAELNPQQKQAVEAIEGPVLVIAGPGTGKTQVLAMRIANILQQTDAQASNILCLTFTESGVAAMRKRLQEIIGTDAYQVKINTFHGFGIEVMQTFPEKFATATNLVQLDELGKVKLMREILDNVSPDKKLELRPFNDRYYHAKGITDAIKSLKAEDVSAEMLRQAAKDDMDALQDQESSGLNKTEFATAVKIAKRNLEVADFYEEYDRLMIERGCVDFNDMIRKVIKRLSEDDELLAYYQERFLYILVDEYQDTNRSQNEIITLLGNFDESPNIFAVGDDDQAIYRFQGANVENLLYFQEKFTNTQTIPISTSYRSNQAILDLAQSLIKHNTQRMVNLVKDLDKTLKSGAKVGNYKPELYEFESGLNETQFIVAKIQELIAAGMPPKEIAILYHHHADADDVVEALLRAKLPIQLAAGRNALRERPVQMLLQLLSAIAYTADDRDRCLFKVLYYGFLGLDRVDVFKVTHFAGDKHHSLYRVISDPALLEAAQVANPESFLEFTRRLAEWSQFAAENSLVRFIEEVGAKSGLIDFVFKESTVQMEEINGIHSFYDFARLQNKITPDLTLEQLLKDIELMQSDGLNVKEQELDVTNKGIQLMTAHGSKGLEFQCVFIIKMHSAKWGNKPRHGSSIKLPQALFALDGEIEKAADKQDYEIEDQRRLLFVAITRAKERLYLTYSLKYEMGDSTREVGPSLFIAEMDPECYIKGIPDAYSKTTPEQIKAGIEPLPQLDQSEQEREYLQTMANNFKLSATALNEYIKCPVNFKYAFMLKVPQIKTKASVLGTAIHKGMEEFYKPVIDGGEPDKDLMMSALKDQLKQETLGEKVFTEYLEEGTRLLEDYYEFYKGKGFGKPIAVECNFNTRGVVLQHAGMDPIPLVGKLDRIDWIDQATGTVKVIDYKTGTPKTQGEIRGTTKNSDGSVWRQVVFYKLLGDLDPFFRPLSGPSKYNIVEAEIDFIKPDGAPGKYRREALGVSNTDVEELKATVVEVMQCIRNLEFGTGEKYKPCGECEFCQMLNLQ